MSKKNILLLLLVAVVVVTVFAFIVVKSTKPKGGEILKQQSQVNPDNEKEVDISDWKVYRNEEYGFEVDYPSKFIAKDWAHKTPNNLLLLCIGENKDIFDSVVSIKIEKDLNSFGPKAIWPFSIEDKNLNLEETTIGKENYLAKKFSLKHSASEDAMSMGIGKLNFVNYFIEHSGLLYQIHYNKVGDLDEDSFNNILASFKFTNRK